MESPAFLSWQPLALTARGFVNFGPLFGHAEHISAYALQRIYSPEKQDVAVLLGSDEYVQLWLNDKQIYEYPGERGAKPDENAVLATLEPGWNTMLAHVSNVTGAHALYCPSGPEMIGDSYPGLRRLSPSRPGL